MVTLEWREEMQSEEGGSLVRRDGSGSREAIPYVLSPRCVERHFPVNCLLFRKLPVQHRVSLLSAASVCKKCLSHSKRDGGRTKQCECAADFSLLNLPKGKSLGRSKPATDS